MADVYYIRHGESETNLLGVFAGGSDDTPLTPKGRQQATDAGKKMRGVRFNKIITSPLSRAVNTAELIAKQVDFPVSGILIDERLREYDLGSGSRIPVEGMSAKKMVAFSGAEDPEEFANRVNLALKDIASYDGTILVVAHGGVGRLIEVLRLKKNPADFYDSPGYPNAEAVKLNLDWVL